MTTVAVRSAPHSTAPAAGIGEPTTLTSGVGSVHRLTAGGLLLLGAWTDDDTRGCWRCALLWSSDVSPDTPLVESATEIPAWWHTTIDALTRLVVQEGVSWTRRLRIVDLDTGAVSVNSFIPHTKCARCSELDGSASVISLDLTAPQFSLPGGLRTRRVDPAELREALVDYRFGPVAHVYRDEESPLALLTAEAVVPGRATREGGYGRSTDFRSSEVPALLEGIERVAGGYRHPSQSTIVGSYRQLRNDAIDPRTLGEHVHSRATHQTFDYDAFDQDASTSWVWSWSTREHRPLLVPEHVAYWHEKGQGSRFFYESSNGCAVGSTFEEAVLHGLFEVAERDAFLLAWYSRSHLAEITVELEGSLAHTRDSIAERGLDLLLLDLTTELGVPTVMAIVTAPDWMVELGLAPGMSLASGAHLNPRLALAAAIEETATNALMYPKWVGMRPSVAVGRCAPMLGDFNLVRTLDDHTGLHGLPAARPLWDFLAKPSKRIDFARFAPSAPEGPVDVVAALRCRVAAVHAAGMDMLVVDQSIPHLRDAFGVHAVKVIVPGTMPMTFGHLHQRTVGLPRLLRATSLLRGASPSESPGFVSSIPHPFP